MHKNILKAHADVLADYATKFETDGAEGMNAIGYYIRKGANLALAIATDKPVEIEPLPGILVQPDMRDDDEPTLAN